MTEYTLTGEVTGKATVVREHERELSVVMQPDGLIARTINIEPAGLGQWRWVHLLCVRDGWKKLCQTDDPGNIETIIRDAIRLLYSVVDVEVTKTEPPTPREQKIAELERRGFIDERTANQLRADTLLQDQHRALHVEIQETEP